MIGKTFSRFFREHWDLALGTLALKTLAVYLLWDKYKQIAEENNRKIGEELARGGKADRSKN